MQHSQHTGEKESTTQPYGSFALPWGSTNWRGGFAMESFWSTGKPVRGPEVFLFMEKFSSLSPPMQRMRVTTVMIVYLRMRT